MAIIPEYGTLGFNKKRPDLTVAVEIRHTQATYGLIGVTIGMLIIIAASIWLWL